MDELPRSIVAWAERQVGDGARATDIQPLRPNPGDRGPWRMTIAYAGTTRTLVVKTGPAEQGVWRQTTTHVDLRESMVTEARALELARSHGIPVPDLVGLDLSGTSGRLAILTTLVPGRPGVPGPDTLTTLGRTIAGLRDIRLEPTAELPLRTRPRAADHYVRRRQQEKAFREGSAPERDRAVAELLDDRPDLTPDRARTILGRGTTTPLLEQAERVLRELPDPTSPADPTSPTVLVHGDVANVVWNARTPTLIDWEGAGAGWHLMDLANGRFEFSLHHGIPAATAILRGWQETTGERPDPEALARWDLVDALNTPTDLSRWAPGLAGATERRNAFLRSVLSTLDA